MLLFYSDYLRCQKPCKPRRRAGPAPHSGKRCYTISPQGGTICRSKPWATGSIAPIFLADAPFSDNCSAACIHQPVAQLHWRACAAPQHVLEPWRSCPRSEWRCMRPRPPLLAQPRISPAPGGMDTGGEAAAARCDSQPSRCSAPVAHHCRLPAPCEKRAIRRNPQTAPAGEPRSIEGREGR